MNFHLLSESLTIQFLAQQKTPIQTSYKVSKKLVFDNLKDKRKTQKPQFKLGQLVRTADI